MEGPAPAQAPTSDSNPLPALLLSGPSEDLTQEGGCFSFLVLSKQRRGWGGKDVDLGVRITK